MNLFKNIKDGKLYILYNSGTSYTALPYKHNGKPIMNCNMKEFVPADRNYKNYLIIKYGEKCMECGWCEIHPITKKVPIQLEHIDGNSHNNNLDNLKLLCPNCHSLTPTYGALNKGSGRKNRKR